MSEKTTHTLLGAFIIGAIIIAVGALLLMAGNGYKASSQRVVMVFDSSVKGLNIGAPVALRGVNIGEVTGIRLHFEGKEELSLFMEVEAVLDASRISLGFDDGVPEPEELISAGLRAQLNSQSLLTGLLYIQLDFFPDSGVNLRARTSNLLEIPTTPSRFEMLFEEIDRLDLPRMVSDLQRTAVAMREFSESSEFHDLPRNLNETLESTVKIAEDTKALLTRLVPKVEQTLNSTAAAAKTTEEQLPLIAANIKGSLDQLDKTLVSLEGAGNNIEAALHPDSPLLYNLSETLAELARASRAVNTLARSIDEQPQSLIIGRPEEED